jgi:hypothetical protein
MLQGLAELWALGLDLGTTTWLIVATTIVYSVGIGVLGHIPC